MPPAGDPTTDLVRRHPALHRTVEVIPEKHPLTTKRAIRKGLPRNIRIRPITIFCNHSIAFDTRQADLLVEVDLHDLGFTSHAPYAVSARCIRVLGEYSRQILEETRISLGSTEWSLIHGSPPVCSTASSHSVTLIGSSRYPSMLRSRKEASAPRPEIHRQIYLVSAVGFSWPSRPVGRPRLIRNFQVTSGAGHLLG